MPEEITNEIRWYCIKSQPKHEHIAAAHLRQMPGVEVFCPRLRFKRGTVRGARWFEEAMFPGYLFARFDFPARHKEVGYAFGVTTILKFGGRYAALDDETIEGLRRQTDPEQVAVVDTSIHQGDNVKIVEGALRGLEAVVTNVMSGKERVRVLLTFLGREIEAEVTTPKVLPAKRHPMAAH